MSSNRISNETIIKARVVDRQYADALYGATMAREELLNQHPIDVEAVSDMYEDMCFLRAQKANNKKNGGSEAHWNHQQDEELFKESMAWSQKYHNLWHSDNGEINNK